MALNKICQLQGPFVANHNYVADIKEKLAKIAAEQVYPGDTVFLDASTTTFFMARELKKMKKEGVFVDFLCHSNLLSRP